MLKRMAVLVLLAAGCTTNGGEDSSSSSGSSGAVSGNGSSGAAGSGSSSSSRGTSSSIAGSGGSSRLLSSSTAGASSSTTGSSLAPSSSTVVASSSSSVVSSSTSTVVGSSSVDTSSGQTSSTGGSIGNSSVGGSSGGASSTGASSTGTGTSSVASGSSAGSSAAGSSAAGSSSLGSSSSMGPDDVDGDGWTIADGDCCDADNAPCAQAYVVNPGALEIPGNGVDDDCDPATDDLAPYPTCSTTALQVPTSAVELAQAMDLCATTITNPPRAQRRWGLISATLSQADGTAAPPPDDVQTGVLSAFGPNVLPQSGATMAAISSGTARAPADPGYVHPQNGPMAGQLGSYNAGTQAGLPMQFLAAHGGDRPQAACAGVCSGLVCNRAFDSVKLTLRVRVPTNVTALTGRVFMFTAEYPEYQCQSYNDAVVILARGNHPGLPADGNVLAGPQGVPLDVNDPRMDVCFPAVGAPPGSCSGGTFELIGTGYGGWNNAINDGAGTGWRDFTIPVVPGETLEVDFIIWDEGDNYVDSLALLDRLRWTPLP